MQVDKYFYSYEGEGDLLGTKTFFCHYPGDVDLCDVYNPDGVGALFINADVLEEEVYVAIKCMKKIVTVEVDGKYFSSTPQSVRYPDHLRFFIVVGEYIKFKPFHGFVKIRVFEREALVRSVDLANQYAADGKRVLLMPEYILDGQYVIGEDMMGVYKHVDPLVRVAPPSQLFLGIR